MTTIRPTVTIGVPPNTRLLRIERVTPTRRMFHDPIGGAWMVWISANIDFTRGTYILLNDDGTIDRVTVNPDGTEDVFAIKKEGD